MALCSVQHLRLCKCSDLLYNGVPDHSAAGARAAARSIGPSEAFRNFHPKVRRLSRDCRLGIRLSRVDRRTMARSFNDDLLLEARQSLPYSFRAPSDNKAPNVFLMNN